MAWSLIGLRKGSEYQADLERINPPHIIVVGLVAIFALVAFLVAVVNWVVWSLGPREKQQRDRESGAEMSATTHGATPYYYVPAESRHPIMAAAGLFFDPRRQSVDQRE